MGRFQDDAIVKALAAEMEAERNQKGIATGNVPNNDSHSEEGSSGAIVAEVVKLAGSDAFGGLAFVVDKDTGFAIAYDVDSGWACGPVFPDGVGEAAGFLGFVQATGVEQFAELSIADQKLLYESYLKMVDEIDQL